MEFKKKKKKFSIPCPRLEDGGYIHVDYKQAGGKGKGI